MVKKLDESIALKEDKAAIINSFKSIGRAIKSIDADDARKLLDFIIDVINVFGNKGDQNKMHNAADDLGVEVD